MATVEKLENNQVKLEIHISADKFEEGMKAAYLKTGKRFNIAGFRKGKAPRKVIESSYGPGVFYEEAFEAVYEEAYIQAVEEAGISPVDAPDVSIVQIGSGEELVFTATVSVKPEIVLGAYKGIEVEKLEYNVTDVQVDAEIARERETQARFVEVDRPVENGDKVNLDYSGSVDGVKFDGGTAQDQTLDIGSGRFIPGFEEQLIGMAKGEEKDITVKFPEEYQAAELAGKEAVFAIKINEIKVKELPELDDEFAKDVSEYDTLDELKAANRKRLEETAQKNAQSRMENAAVAAAVANVTVDIPQAMVERQLNHMMRDMEYRLSYQGIKMDDFLKYTGQTIEQMRSQYADQALAQTKSDLVLEAIVVAEGIEADEAEVEVEIENLAKGINKTVEEAKAMLTPGDMRSIKIDLAKQKAVAFLLENAVFVDKKEQAE